MSDLFPPQKDAVELFAPEVSEDTRALLEFLQDTINTTPIDTWELWQHLGATRGELRLNQHRVEALKPDELAAKITRIVARTSKGFMANQTYRVTLLFQGVVQGSHVMGKEPGLARAPNLAEPADNAGALSQQMRHNEALMRALYAATNVAGEHLQRLLKMAYERILILEAREQETIDTYWRLKKEEADVEGTKIRAQARGATEKMLLEQLVRILPHAASIMLEKFSGKPLVPSLLVELRNFIESLRPEQLKRIGEVFDEKQQAQFMRLLGQNDLVTEATMNPAPAPVAEPEKAAATT